MNKVQAKRLLNVAKALRDAAEWKDLAARFSMHLWGYPQTYANTGDKVAKHFKEKGCGTPACALGHYAARRDLQRGFYLSEEGDVRADINDLCYSLNDSILEHFGVTYSEGFDLFSDVGCGNATTPRMAALYIERFVERKQKEQRA